MCLIIPHVRCIYIYIIFAHTKNQCKQPTQAPWTAPGSTSNTYFQVNILTRHLVEGMIHNRATNLGHYMIYDLHQFKWCTSHCGADRSYRIAMLPTVLGRYRSHLSRFSFCCLGYNKHHPSCRFGYKYAISITMSRIDIY